MNNIYPFPGEQPPRGGGPEGPSMEQRVARLEEQFASIDAKLNTLSSIEVQLAEIKGQLSQMPKATEFGHLRGDVSRLAERTTNLPSMWQMMLGFLGIIVAILWKTK